MQAVSNSFFHLQDAINAVDQKIDDFNNKISKSIKASSGLIITCPEPQGGDMGILMGRLNKLDRPIPKDPAGVHNSYGLFSGSVELKDTGKEIPAVCAAAAREVNEESLGILSEEKVLAFLQQPSTKLLKNAGWNDFAAATFQVEISKEEGDKIIKEFNANVKNNLQPEITELAWIPLSEIVAAQENKEAKYNVLKGQLELERGSPFKREELAKVPELVAIYNENIKVSSGVEVAHYVARTIFASRDQLNK